MDIFRQVERALAKGDLNAAKMMQLKAEQAILAMDDLSGFSLDELDDIAHSLGIWDTIEHSFG